MKDPHLASRPRLKPLVVIAGLPEADLEPFLEECTRQGILPALDLAGLLMAAILASGQRYDVFVVGFDNLDRILVAFSSFCLVLGESDSTATGGSLVYETFSQASSSCAAIRTFVNYSVARGRGALSDLNWVDDGDPTPVEVLTTPVSAAQFMSRVPHLSSPSTTAVASEAALELFEELTMGAWVQHAKGTPPPTPDRHMTEEEKAAFVEKIERVCRKTLE